MLTGIQVTAAPQSWFSFGFEAFGAPTAFANILDEAVRLFFAGNAALPGIRLSESDSLNYPAWLARLLYTPKEVMSRPGA